MNVLVTGASGFIGRAVVAEARRRGHCIHFFARHEPAVAGPASAIIHLAPTVEGMQRLIDAAPAARFILISSLAVYDFLSLRENSVLDERAPLAPDPAAAGAYVQTKLAQEELVRRHAPDFTIVRPGIVHGPGREWFHHLGTQISPRHWLCLAPESLLPLTSLANCAAAIVDALDAEAARGATLNVVDDEPPTRAAYVASLAAHATPRPAIHTLSWAVLNRAARIASATGMGSLHDLFNATRVAARCKPLRYSNKRAKEALNWRPTPHAPFGPR